MGGPAAAPNPVPAAVRLPDGLVLRGHEWPVDGPAVVFLHDFGDDLDAWGPLTARLAGLGFRVISLELRGHGLSGGEPDPAALREDLTAALGQVCASFGPVGLAAYGAVTEALLFLDSRCGAPVQVMISPRPLAPEKIDWRTTRPAERLVLRGALHEESARQAGFIYPRMKGRRMEVTGAADLSGPPLLAGQPQLFEHMAMFLRRYLTGYHLAWIAGRAEQIEAARAERLAAERSRTEPGAEPPEKEA